jgi:heme exporter protein D
MGAPLGSVTSRVGSLRARSSKLVEHAAPRRFRFSARWLDHPPHNPGAAVAHGSGFYIAVRDAALGGNAQRDFAPARADATFVAGERSGLTMQATAHIDFIAAAYGAGIVVIGALIAWVVLDYRMQRRILAELEAQGIARRSAPVRKSAEHTATEDA